MEFESETKIIISSFGLIGIAFYGQHRFLKPSCYIKVGLKVFAEFMFTLFVLYNILSTNFYFRSVNPLFVVSKAMMSLSILLLRLTILYKRKQILELITSLHKFLETYQKKPYKSNKKLLVCACLINVCVPLVGTTIFTVFYIKDYEDIEEDLKPDLLGLCSRRFHCERPLVFLINIIHALHCFVTPSVCMTLFIFLYDTYQNALEQMLAEAALSLNSSLSLHNMSRTIGIVLKAAKVHKKIESVLSLSIFAIYVLVFVNFLNVMLVSFTYSDHPKSLFRLSGYCIIFLWTLSSFFKLTLTGSRLVEICEKWRIQQQEIVHNCATQRYKTDFDILANCWFFVFPTRSSFTAGNFGLTEV
ncbi:hypothetical protein JTE90_008281 [Oedothorax gibbosus]|uniref:Gustatory receptor n=1 Tax=Oedothorax gibbosus TaxID=931172 RepID=A0AAV6UGP9_9ARAC|nr:hypothetical protein JTE90_008281 [Oedothorax gibbosus]